MKLASLEDYVPDKSLTSIEETDFTKIVILTAPFGDKPYENEVIQELTNEDFINQFYSLKEPLNRIFFSHKFKGFQTPLTKSLMESLFHCSSTLKVEQHLLSNLQLDGTGISKIYLTFDEENYNAKNAESEATIEKLKTEFLNDLFDDSDLECNAHNRLILEKAWTIACNVDYYDHYMSVNFYITVQRWFNKLKDLAI